MYSILSKKYSWNKDYLERLIDDIELLADKYPSHSFKKGENYHFLSTITTKSKGHSNKNEIIDGQQRTITLIFTNFALFKYLCQRKIKDYEIPWIYDSMFNNSYDNQDYDNQDFVGKWIDNPSKLNGLLNFSKLFENNIEAIQDIWGGKKINGKESKPNKINQDEGEKQLKENLIYIYSYLSNKLDQKDDLYVKDFVERLLYGFVINHVEVQEGASEQIFERMNLMSKKLNNLEMLKAYIYERLINKDLEDKEIQINLENFMQLFYSFFIKGKPKAENLEVTESPNLKLFTTYLNNKYELKMNSNYEYSPLYIIKKFLEIHSNEAKDDSWLEALLLEKLKFQYSLIKNQEHFNNWKNDFDKFKKIYPKREKTSNPDLIEWLFPFVSMASKGNVTVFLPLVIFILDSFEILDKKIEGGETKKLSIWREVIKLLFEIERFTFIWKTAKFEGQSLSRGVYILIDKLKKESNLTAQALRKGLFELVFNNQKVLLVDDKFILDDEFKLTIYNEIDNNFKNNVDSKSRNSEYTELMFRIIWYLKNSRNSFPRLNSWWHIGEFEVLFKEPSWDHFYATNSKIKNLDIESNEDKDKLINSIGNGFILQSSLNSKYKNNSVEEKYDNLKKQTGIFLSFVNSQEGLEPLSKEWNSEKIEKRRDDIVELIKEIYLKS
ncbi:DUF262 domain-containing protein [Mycoplasmopsis gallopavonis]|uniref:DUF262 domain-containing protein n=1 Tax=Mycoplasmopsis gallopavonis TaxID=76629 RepID=UPI0029624744|nr:DUF262 domain-containing protein [Mycoplasmopsis gallopavonis]